MGRLSNEEKLRRSLANQSAPPAGGSVQPTPQPIKQMSGFGSREEMEASLVENTMTSGDEKPRKTRRTKAEMNQLAEVDPLMSDPLYKKYVEDIRSGGVATTIKGGFKAARVATQDASWDLDPEEDTKIEGFSYVLAKKYPVIDPTNHWFGMLLYFVSLMSVMIFKRVGKGAVESFLSKLQKLFTGDEDELKSAQELENEKAQSA